MVLLVMVWPLNFEMVIVVVVVVLAVGLPMVVQGSLVFLPSCGVELPQLLLVRLRRALVFRWWLIAFREFVMCEHVVLLAVVLLM